MKKLLIICMSFFISCNEKEMIDVDRFNLFTPNMLYFDSNGGTQIVTATDYILLDGVFLYGNDGNSETIVSVPSECGRQYPYVFETEWVTVNRTNATTLEITVPPRTDKTKINILVSGIADDGEYLCPNRIRIYQNYGTGQQP